MQLLPDVTQLPVGRNGRLLAIGILMVGLGMLWTLVGAPMLGWYDQRDQAIANRARYDSRMAAIAAELPAARAAAAAARLQAPPPDMILAGGSDSIAGAALESVIDGLTRDAGATLISTEAVPAVQDGAYRRIGLHVSARAPWTKLIDLLAAIERAETKMSIGNLQIQAGPLGGAEQLLDMSLTVTAFRAGTEAVPSAADAAPDSNGAGP